MVPTHAKSVFSARHIELEKSTQGDVHTSSIETVLATDSLPTQTRQKPGILNSPARQGKLTYQNAAP
jgi:hypothetical protein